MLQKSGGRATGRLHALAYFKRVTFAHACLAVAGIAMFCAARPDAHDAAISREPLVELHAVQAPEEARDTSDEGSPAESD